MKKSGKTTPLCEKFKRDLIIRGRSQRTVDGYVTQVRGLAKYYGRSPDQITNDEVKDYLLYLINERHLTFSTCNVAVSAFHFFYHQTLGLKECQFPLPMAKKPKKLPVQPGRNHYLSPGGLQ